MFEISALPRPASRALYAALVMSCLLYSNAFCQSSGDQYQLTQSVAGGGGGTSSSGALQVDGTAGQSVTGVSSGGAFSIFSGFWSAITPPATTISVANVTGTYGGTLTLTATLSSQGAGISNRTITFTLNGTDVGTANSDASGRATLTNVSLSGINAGTYAGAVTARFDGDLTFGSSHASGQLTVQKATPLLQVTGGIFTYDGQPHPATASATGVNNEALTPVTILYNGASSVPVNAGMYAMTASFAGDQNYHAVTNNQQSIIINRAGQTIAFGALSDKTFSDADFAVSATATSGLALTFAASGQCTMTGNTIHITGAGSCTITASQGGDANYHAALPVDRSFSISKATATVTLTNLSQTYDGAAKAATAVTAPVGLSVTLSYSQNGMPVTSPTAAGSYDVVAAVTDADHHGSATGVLVIGKATPVITWARPANITYGTALTGAQLNAVSSVPGSFTYDPPAGTLLAAGADQTLSATFTPADMVNYTQAGAAVLITVSEPAILLLTEEQDRARAVALDAVTFMRGPFRATTSYFHAEPTATRVMLFTQGLGLAAGEDASDVVVEVEDSRGVTYRLEVEFAGKAPGADWLWQLNVRLPQELAGAGEVTVTVRAHGRSSNRGAITIAP